MKTFTKSDMILNKGEVHILGYGVSTPESYYYNTDLKSCQQYRCEYGENKMLLYTTNINLTTVKQLDRQKFVKPVDDVKKLANDQSKLFYHEPSEIKSHFKLGFKAGYKANKAEFTMEEMEDAMNLARNKAHYLSNNSILNQLRPLSIPEYIVIDNDEIVEVKW